GLVPPRRAADSAPAAKSVDNKALRGQLRDEIEVLEAQLAVKSAQLQASRIASSAAKERWDRMQQITGKGPSAVSEAEVSKSKLAAAMAEADVKVREAEVREPMVKLAHARRRLEGLERDNPAAAGRSQVLERIKALELKLDTMRKELEALR